MNSEKTLYLFDFDGTLTNVDTLFDFLKTSFAEDYLKNYLKHIPFFVLAKLKLRNTEKVKQNFISSFLKGKSRNEIRIISENYFKLRGEEIIRKSGADYIRQIDAAHDKYIVSASLDIWLEPFANHFNMALICTKVEFNHLEIFTGNFSTPNCNYQEKRKRIENEIDLSLYKEVLVFGDTKGDEAMFSLSTQKFFKQFH